MSGRSVTASSRLIRLGRQIESATLAICSVDHGRVDVGGSEGSYAQRSALVASVKAYERAVAHMILSFFNGSVQGYCYA